MNKDIINISIAKLQNPKLKAICLILVLSTQIALPLLFPLLKEVGFANPPILRLSAHTLLLLAILTIFYLIEWAVGKTSDLKCPFCGSYKFFIDDREDVTSKATKISSDPELKKQGFIRRQYRCKACGNVERLYVKPIEFSHAISSPE